MGEEINLCEAMAHSTHSRLQLPLLFLQIPSNSRVSISQDDSKMHLRLESDSNFVLRDENVLFQNMGLTKTSDEELRRIISPQITDYLKQQVLIESPTIPVLGKRDTRPELQDYVEDRDDLVSTEQLVRSKPPSFAAEATKHTPLTKLLPSRPEEDCPAGIEELEFGERSVKNLSQPFMNTSAAVIGGGQESIATAIDHEQ